MPNRDVNVVLNGLDKSPSCAAYRMGFAAVKLTWPAARIAERLSWINKHYSPKIVYEFTLGMMAATEKDA